MHLWLPFLQVPVQRVAKMPKITHILGYLCDNPWHPWEQVRFWMEPSANQCLHSLVFLESSKNACFRRAMARWTTTVAAIVLAVARAKCGKTVAVLKLKLKLKLQVVHKMGLSWRTIPNLWLQTPCKSLNLPPSRRWNWWKNMWMIFVESKQPRWM